MQHLYDVPAPAKLNLFLHVVGRRADGYHLLQSVFRLIDWQDTLHFDKCTSDEITRTDLIGQLPTVDLTVRAARLLQQSVGYRGGVRISLIKRIPQEAGLGGGSSDAASCLLALNKLWNLNLPRNTLAELGLRLGADVPFFIHGTDAWVEGIGEIITPLVDECALPPARYVVVKPALGASTAQIFASPRLSRSTPRATMLDFVANRIDGSFNDYKDLVAAHSKQVFSNDLAVVAQSLCPEIGEALSWLSSLNLVGRMTGSGSAVFAEVDSSSEVQIQAAWAQSGFDARGWQYRVCSSVPVHPLLG